VALRIERVDLVRSAATAAAANEPFCTRCGAAIASGALGAASATRPSPISIGARITDTGHLGKARTWLLAISVITLISGLVFFAIQKPEVEKQIREAEVATAGIDPVERDRLMRKEVGMSFSEAMAHDRGQVTLLLAINVSLAVIYFGLWFWAKKNPYMAALIALMLFLAVIVVSAVFDPKTIAQGVIVKVLFLLALTRAVKAGNEERRLLGAM
jgi:hypothetical protein